MSALICQEREDKSCLCSFRLQILADENLPRGGCSESLSKGFCLQLKGLFDVRQPWIGFRAKGYAWSAAGIEVDDRAVEEGTLGALAVELVLRDILIHHLQTGIVAR